MREKIMQEGKFKGKHTDDRQLSPVLVYFFDRQGIPKHLFENFNGILTIHDFISTDIKYRFLNSEDSDITALRTEVDRLEFYSIKVKSLSQAKAAFELCKVRGFIRGIM